MRRFASSLVLFFVCTYAFPFQQCDDDDEGPLLFELLALLAGDEDEESYDHRDRPRDTVRTEETEVRVGVNMLRLARIREMKPKGVEMAVYQEMAYPGLYVGGAFSIFNYGFTSYDTLFGDYNHINTGHNIYGLNVHMKQRIINERWFKAYVGLQTGITFFHTFSKAVDRSCDCDREPDKTLHTQFSARSNVGPTLDLQIPVSSAYDRISIHVGYQMTGRGSYVKKGDVEIAPNRIRFFESLSRLNLLNFQIGYSHFF